MTLLEGAVTLTGWITTAFFYIALLIITPWLIALLYDLLLYTWRSITYDIPYIGGRARGARPPRAPTLAEHADDAGSTRMPPVELAEQVVNKAEQVVNKAERMVTSAVSDVAHTSSASSGVGVADYDSSGDGSPQQRTLRRTNRQVSRSPK